MDLYVEWPMEMSALWEESAAKRRTHRFALTGYFGAQHTLLQFQCAEGPVWDELYARHEAAPELEVTPVLLVQFRE
jgi:hypothetical protein